MSQASLSLDEAFAASTPTSMLKTPEIPLLGVTVTWPVELSTLIVRLELLGLTTPA